MTSSTAWQEHLEANQPHRYKLRITLIANKIAIQQSIDSGYALKNIYDSMTHAGLISCSYTWFAQSWNALNPDRVIEKRKKIESKFILDSLNKLAPGTFHKDTA